MSRKQKQKGFTLIELLTVVSIIGLLSSIVLSSMKSAKDKANIAAFVQNLHQLQVALEMYKLDTGYYPYENDPVARFPGNYPGADEITPALTSINFLPKYIPQFPKKISSTDEIYYFNPKKANSSPYYTCGNAIPIKGYLIYYINNSSAYNLPFPSLFIGSSPQSNYYCVTAN